MEEYSVVTLVIEFSRKDECVVITLEDEMGGLEATLTPEKAREVAKRINSAADKAECGEVSH